MDCSMQGFPVLHYFIEFAQTHVHWVGDAIQLSHPLSSPAPPAFSLSQNHGLFQWVGLISFRMDWFYFLAVQGTLKSLLQHHNSKAPILWHSALFIVQLSQPYMTTGKNHSFAHVELVGKVMCLLFNTQSTFVIAFLPRSKCILISWLHSPSAVILEPKRIKSLFPFFPICLPWSDGTRCHDLSFWMLSFKSTFSLPSFTFIKKLFNSSLLSALRVMLSAYLRL